MKFRNTCNSNKHSFGHITVARRTFKYFVKLSKKKKTPKNKKQPQKQTKGNKHILLIRGILSVILP